MDVVLNDAELARQITGGDRDAEAELFRRMAPRVRLYGLRHLRDVYAAEDLAQQVLITVLEALRAGRLRDPVEAERGLEPLPHLREPGPAQCGSELLDELC